VLNEFYRVAFPKKIYPSVEELQKDVDEWLAHYNNHRTHQGKRCQGRTPMDMFMASLELAKQKNLDKKFTEVTDICQL
jgi:DNA uptake protein ComE-like DNA-binding protein